MSAPMRALVRHGRPKRERDKSALADGAAARAKFDARAGGTLKTVTVA